MTRHLRSLLDLDRDEVERVLSLAARVKENPSAYRSKLDGKNVAMIFAKPSTRTRVSFEVGLNQMGATGLYLPAGGATGLQVNRGETNHDTAKVLSRYVDAIVIRTFAQAQVDELAEFGTVPVVNALTDEYHPCQALADAMTIRERFGTERRIKLTWVGPGNNVTHSLMLMGPRTGIDVVGSCPATLPPSPTVLEQATRDAQKIGTTVVIETDPAKAVEGADVVYTDTFVSMGQEDEKDELLAKLADYQVTGDLMAKAKEDAVFMHCLPAHRGEEVTDEVIDGPQSIVFDEAENRLHAQKALMLLLMEAEPWS
ncbi:MAG TPA: ornithine carbamoyltransferase [Polyangiaceae bacterium]|nr:ornithine carbamoyltransferase [Polyangiaceae bacterium]